MPIIEVKHLHKRYGDVVAVDDASLTVEQGEILGILGRNGAGKTTTVEIMVGLRPRDRGEVTVLGLDPARDRAELVRRIGVQLQQSELPARMRVWEALDLYASFYPDPADWRELLAEWGLSARRNACFGTLSGGERQRLFIALALVGRPEVVFLDELTTGLDPRARRTAWELIENIRRKGVTVVLVTHFMAEAERLCDRVAVFDRGRVVAVGSPAALVARVAPGQRLRFRPSAPVPERLLTGLPEVTSVTRQGGHLLVSGDADVVQAVTAELAKSGIRAEELQVDRAGLDEAFAVLTGHDIDD
jgi:ABC-type multidrug transport system, ATPase component